MKQLADTTQLTKRSLLTKYDYFERSMAQGLPNRCPLLTRCARRAFTQTLTPEGQEAEKQGWLKAAEPVVPMIEDTTFVGGSGNFYVKHLCPEVALFEQGFTFPGLRGMPVTEAEFDKYWPVPYSIRDTGHFSECAEYIAALPTAATAPSTLTTLSPKWQIVTSLRENLSAIATILGVIVAIYILLWGDGIFKP
jgi:hypothetical protein